MRTNKSLQLTLGGVITALSLVLLLLTSIFPFAVYSLPAMAGLLLVCLVLESGYQTALTAFFSVGILGVLMVPNKEVMVLYLLFLGYYPIAKGKIEVLRSSVVGWIVKLALFNLSILITYLIFVWLFETSAMIRDMEVFQYGVWGLWLLNNVTFVMYDIAASRLVVFYLRRIRPKYRNSKR